VSTSGNVKPLYLHRNSPTVANLTHQLRQFQQQHLNPLASASTKSVQLAITAQKGIALDHDTLSRDLTLLAKEQEGWLKSMAIQPTTVGGAVAADNASVISETTSAAAAILRNLQTEIEDREAK
jgi:hypothetical protein